MKKRLICLLLLGVMSVTSFGCGNSSANGTTDGTGNNVADTEDDGVIDPIVIDKSQYGNPIGGFDAEGDLIYGGDPAVLVDGDTVYLYTGHDTSTNDSYVIPEYQCYSTKDLKTWKYEGVVMSMKDVSWGEVNSGWAGQVAKHYDAELGKDMYYLYFCSWDSTDSGKQSIGVAVSESPTGPFVDKGEALVKGSFTTDETSAWNDIDPTIWIEDDANGEEHIYMVWGNSKVYVCELNQDMVSVKDIDGDGRILFSTDVLYYKLPASFTEAPWIYRRQDENGKYYGDYYLFYAYGWREQMAYATASADDSLLDALWEYGDILMPPTATSNTNHPAVFDFKGKTYFIYHNGSLANGSGFRRVACIEELVFKDNGDIERLVETATGINGIISTLTSAKGDALAHIKFVNSGADAAYPYKDIAVGSGFDKITEAETYWEIVPGKADTANEYYVSIEAYNKAGLYITANTEATIVLAQDYDGKQAEAQTFKTVEGLAGEGVSFESVKYEGMYLTLADGVASLTDGSNKEACTFNIETIK